MTDTQEAPPADAEPESHGSFFDRVRRSLRGPDAARRGLLVVFALAAVTRLVYAFSRSLVLDEFHSYYHATAPNWEAFLAGLYRDNHPPLSFLIIGAATKAFGLAEWALRSPAFLFGLLEIAVVASWAGSLARRANEEPHVTTWSVTAVPIWAAALLAASTLHFDYGTQARMYAPLALCITVATYSAMTLLVRDEEENVDAPMFGATFAFGVAAAAAFHTHYFALQYLVILAGVFTPLALFTGKWVALRNLAVATVIAAISALPWVLTGFFQQLKHDLAPGGDDVSFTALGEAFVQLFFHNIRFGGPVGRYLFVLGAALVLLLALRGLVLALLSRRLRSPVLLLAAMAFAVPALSWALAAYVPRTGFTWHYVLPSSAAMAVLFALGTRGRVASAIATVPLGLATVLLGLHLTHPATEDFRAAVQFALDEVAAAPEDEIVRVVSVEWQPALFPLGQPYDYYAPLLSEGPAPEREGMWEGYYTVNNVTRLHQADRVVVVRRSLPEDQHLMRKLREVFPHRTVTNFGFGVDVLVYTR